MSRRCCQWLALMLMMLLTSSPPLMAQRVLVNFDNAEVEVARIQINPTQLEQWVFGNQRNGANPRESARKLLQIELDFITETGPLSEDQRSKLELAGQGDIHRFFEDFEVLCRSVPTGSITQEEMQKIWTKTSPYQIRFRSGIFGPGSLFRRTVSTTLDAEQQSLLGAADRERRMRYFTAALKGAVASIETRVPLTASQRDAFLECVLENSEPPIYWGDSQYHYYQALNAISKVPEDKLRPIFLPNEWKAVQQVMSRGRVWDAQLQQINRNAENWDALAGT